jgi:hypothetical protein
MSRTGRPETLSELKRRQVLAILSIGGSRRTAAMYVNCSPTTIANTARRDPAFADQLARAELAVEVAHLRNVQQAAKDKRHWKASVWVLERLFPERYGDGGVTAANFRGAKGDDGTAPSLEQIVEFVFEQMLAAGFRQRWQLTEPSDN